jgi:hypothetical protein
MNVIYFLVVLNLLLLLMILRLSFKISRLPEQLTTLRNMVLAQKDGLVNLIGKEWIEDTNSTCPKIDRVENRIVYFEDGVQVTEPVEAGNGFFMVIFGPRKLWYETLDAALTSAYTIATTSKCLLQGIKDVEPN